MTKHYDILITTTSTAPRNEPGAVFNEICVAAGRVRDARDNGSTSLAVAHAVAVGDVRRAASDSARDDSDSATSDALRRLVRESLHVLGAEVLRDLRAAVLAGRCRRWLRELSHDARCAGELERAIAASAIASAGESVLYDAMAIRAGVAFTWQLDPDEIVRTQRCCAHNVFCCLACPDEPIGLRP